MRAKRDYIIAWVILAIIATGFFVTMIIASQKPQANIVIKNADVLTINKNMDRFQNGVVVIRDNKIVEVGEASLANKYSAAQTIDAKGAIVMPGMVNTHQHIPMIAFRGLGEEGIQDRLFSYFMPLEKNKLNPDLITKATTHGCIDMVTGGVTTYADMYFYTEEMAAATKAVGLRAVIGETVTKFGSNDCPEPYGGLDYARKFIEHYKNDELITPAVAPHASYSVSAEKLLESKNLGDQYNVPVMIHLAEMGNEASKLGVPSEIKYLDEIGFLSERILCAHSIHMNNEELDILKARNVAVAHCPMANAKGATGIADAKGMLERSMRVGIGTDGPMGSNQTDLFRVMSYTSAMQRLKYNDRTIMTPDVVVRMATLGGAEALGMADKIGSLESGKLADITIIDKDMANVSPDYDPYSSLVFAANKSNVQTVIVNGKVIVNDHRLMTYSLEQDAKDIEQIRDDISRFGKELALKAKKD